MSENVGIRVGVELDDSKARTDLNSIVKTLQELTNSKAINIKVDIDGNALKNLEKIESAVKEINKLSRDAQKSLFKGGDNSNADLLKAQKLQEQQKLEMIKANNKLELEMLKAVAKEEQAINKAVLQEESDLRKANIREQEALLKAQLKQEEQARKASQKEQQATIKAIEQEYKQMSDTIAKEMNNAFKNINKLDMSGFVDRGEIDRLKAEFDSVFSAVDWEKLDKADFDRSITEVRRLGNEIDRALDGMNSNRQSGEINLFSDKMFSNLNRMKSEFRSIGNFGSEFSRIEASIRNLDNVAPDRLPQTMRQIRQEVSQLNGDLRNLNSGVRNTNGFFNDLYDSMRTFTLGNMIGNALEDGVRAIKKVVIELDKSMTDMMKVAPEGFEGTSEELKKVGRDANEVAKIVGKSTEDVIQGTAKALQTGAKNMSDAMEIAKNSAMLANVGDITTEQSDTYIASIMSAYGGMDNALKPVRENIQGMGKDYNQLTKFMDLANYAGNNFAISTGDVGEALMRSSSVLSEYGVSMQDSIAMIVGANESVQDSAKVGQSMKSMAINMAGVKASAKDGTMELNKTAKALKEIAGVDIYSDKSKGEVKDMMTLLTELQGKYKNLKEDEQLALGEALAGKHHANTFQALMGNWRKVQEMQKAYQEGSTVGSAQKENERYLNSVSGKINVLKENLKQLVTNVLSSDLTKKILDIGIAITDGLVGVSNFINDIGMSVPVAIGLFTTLVQVIKSLGTGSRIGGLFNLSRVFKGLIPSLGNSTRGFRLLTTSMGEVDRASNRVRNGANVVTTSANNIRNSTTTMTSGLGRATVGFKNVESSAKYSAKGVTASGKSYKVYASSIENGNKAVDKLKSGNIHLAGSLKDNNKALKNATKSSGSWLKGLVSTGAKTTLATVGTGLLNGALMSVAGMGITAVVSGLSWLATAQKRHREEIDKNIEGIHSEMSANQNKISVLGDVGKKYEELSKKGKKSKDDIAQMKTYANQLADVLPELKIGTDSDGNAIISMAGDVDYLIKKLEQANETQARLLKGQQSEKATESMKMLNDGEWWSSWGQLEKRNKIQEKYNNELFLLENKKQKVLNSLKNAEGEDLKKYNQELQKIELEKIKLTSEYGGKYIQEQQKVQELSNSIRENSMNMLMDSSEFKLLDDGAKQNVQDFIGLLDFSEVNSDNLYLADKSLKSISKAVAEGKLDMEDYSKKVMDINNEFSMSGNIERYDEQMRNLAKSIAQTSGADFNTVLNMLKSMDGTSLQAEDGLNKFLGAYNKTLSDISKGDKVAETLKSQFDGIATALSDIANMTGDVEIDKKIAFNLVGDENIPEQIQNMVNVLLNKGFNPTDVLKVTQKILIDLQEGEINVDEAQKWIDEAFGEGAFEVDAGINMTAKVKEARVDEALATLKDKFKEVPEEVETLIKVNSIDSKAEAENVLEMYNDFPKEVETLIETLGYEGAYSKLEGLMLGYNKIPDEVMTMLKANGVNSIEQANRVASIYNQLPENIQTYIMANNRDALLNAKSVDDIYRELPPVVKTDVEMDVTKVDPKKGFIEKFLDSLSANETVAKIDADTVGFDQKTGALIGTLDTFGTKQSVVKIDADASGAETEVSNIDRMLKNFDDSHVGKTKSTTFKTDTKTASQNVTGLKENVDDYDKKHKDKTKNTNFKTDTAKASQNVTGLKRNVSGYVDSYGGKTFSTTFNVVTKYSTQGTPTSQSGGATFGAPKAMSSRAVASPVIANSLPSSEGMSIPTTRTPMPMGSMNTAESTPPSVANPMLRNSVFARATEKTPIANKGFNIADSIKYNVELLQELENRIQMVNNSLTTLDKKMNKAVGKEKIKYLQDQIKLFEEQRKIQKELEDNLIRQKNYTKSVLENKGFKFNSDDNLVNYEEKLIALEKSLANREANLKSLNDKVSNEKNEKKKESLEKQAKSAQQVYDKEKEQLDEIKEYLNRYIQVTMKDLPNAKNEWLELGNKIEDAKNEIVQFNREVKTLRQESMFVSLNKQVDQYNNSLQQIDKAMENAFGKEKSKLMQEKIDILKKQEIQLNRVKNEYSKVQSQLQKELEGYGFTFRDNGDIVNYIQHITKLKEDGNRDFEHIQKIAEEYLDVLVKKIPSLESELLDLNNTLFETQWALQKAQREQTLFANTASIRALELQYDKLADKLELINIQMEHAYGKDKLNLIQSQISLLEEQSGLQEEIIANNKAMLNTYQNDLSKYGVEFNGSGDITNLQEVLNKYKDDKNFEKINSLLEEYIKLQSEDLPDAVKEWEKLNSAIKNAYKEQLNITKEVEDKITEVYKKQVEERKKLIDSELKHRLDAINKEKEAYNKSREEAKYKDNYDEQLKKVKKLEEQLEIAKKDDSLTGQKKVQDLINQLKDEQKKLQDLVQDKIDSSINDMFDKESERLEDEANNAKENLDKEFSDSKIQELVKEALSTGVFEDIDGTMRSLQDVMLKFIDEYGDGLGATGDLIKNEWVANLEVAKSTMEDMVKISKELGLIKFSYNSDELSDAMRSIPSGRSAVNSSPTVNFNQPLINIEGNVDRDVMDELRVLSQEIKDDVIDEIYYKLK